MPTTLVSISNSAIKVRWREPYASESLNRKFTGVVPRGVYRGLKLGTSVSSLSVDVSADAIAGDHVAVVEDQSGYSTTYTDDTSGTITLSLGSFATNDVVVVVLSVDYSVGITTTAEFVGYLDSDYEALSDQDKRDLVVLGTVLVPAPGLIPAANITHDRRTLPFMNRSDASVPWNPLLRNGGFEFGETNGTYRHASPFWKTSTTNANFTVRPVTTEARTGFKSLELTTSAAGVVTATIQQDLWMPVTGGQYVMARLYKKAIQAATTSPSGTLRFVFGDQNGGTDVNEDLSFAVDAIDGGFEELSGIVQVPANYVVLKSIQIIVVGTYAGASPCIRFDDVQAWAQVTSESWLDVRESRSAEGAVGDLFIGASNGFANNAAKLTFDGTILSLERKDEVKSATSQPPVLSVRARGFLETGSNRYTLVFQSEIPITGGSVYYRKYVGALSPALIETVNASWNHGSLQWSKDVTGIVANRFEVRYDGTAFKSRVDDTAWSDSGWIENMTNTGPDIPTVSNPKSVPMLMVRDALGRRRSVIDHNGYIMSRVSEIRQEWIHTSIPQGWAEGNALGGSVLYDGFVHALRFDIPNTLNAYAGVRTLRQDIVPEGSQFVNVMEWENSLGSTSSLADTSIFMGWHQNMANGVADLYIHIGKAQTDANWQLCTHQYTGAPVSYLSAAGANTSRVDTGVAASALATRFRLEWYGASTPGGARAVAYINGTAVAEVTNTATIPLSSMGIGIEMKRTTAAGGTRRLDPGPIVMRHNRLLNDDSGV